MIDWRAYNTDQASFDDHAKLLINRYKKYLVSDDPANDYVAWANALEQGGYSGVGYANSLLDIIRDRNYDMYDQKSNNIASIICPKCDCWSAKGKLSFWNGKNKINGKTVPEITITKSKTVFRITYKGAPSGFLLRHSECGTGDTIHQLCNVFVGELNPYLKEYGLKPDIKNIKMTKSERYFSIQVPLSAVSSGYYVINRRGGMGHGGDYSDLTQYKTRPNYTEIIKTAGDITEKFITYSVGYNKNTIDNKIITNIVNMLYKVLVTEPEKYFGKFKGIFNDDEDAAKNWFISWFNKYKIQLNKIILNTSKENKNSIEAIFELVEVIANEIKAGNSRKYTLGYFIYNTNSSKYKYTLKGFNWEYL